MAKEIDISRLVDDADRRRRKGESRKTTVSAAQLEEIKKHYGATELKRFVDHGTRVHRVIFDGLIFENRSE